MRLFVIPFVKGVQLAPPLTLWNTPSPFVPAYTVAGEVGSIARAVALEFVRPLLTPVQLAPPLTLWNTPPPFVPAYTVAGVAGLIARA
jgi:hypothetical protein